MRKIGFLVNSDKVGKEVAEREELAF